MLEEDETKLKERREADEEALAALVEGLKERNVPVITFNGDLSVERVHKRVLRTLKPWIQERNSFFERLHV